MIKTNTPGHFRLLISKHKPLSCRRFCSSGETTQLHANWSHSATTTDDTERCMPASGLRTPPPHVMEPGSFKRKKYLRSTAVTSARDNYNLKSHKYVCITTFQPDTKSYPNPNPNANPTTKQHAIVNSQLYIVTCLTYLLTYILT